MKSTTTIKWSLLVVVVGCSILFTIIQVNSQEIRSKRQVLRDRQQAANKQDAPISVNRPPRPSVSSVISTSSSIAGINPQAPTIEGNPQVDSQDAAATLPLDPVGASGEVDDDEETRPVKKKRRRKPNRRPAARPTKQNGDYGHEDEEDDEECYEEEDDDDYHHSLFEGMSGNPMRQFTRLMGNAFNTMQGAFDDYNQDYGRGRSKALASAISGGDGYSKAFSSVTNNGRTRGVVSETRNGRTSTRRIGPKGDRDDDDDEY